jgi:hypothetical protein
MLCSANCAFKSCAGSFDKCDICHNADRLLNKKNLFSKMETEIIEAYRRQHIIQQFDERIKLQQNITGTYELDANGRPLSALVFGDGMTAYTGIFSYDLYCQL